MRRRPQSSRHSSTYSTNLLGESGCCVYRSCRAGQPCARSTTSGIASHVEASGCALALPPPSRDGSLPLSSSPPQYRRFSHSFLFSFSLSLSLSQSLIVSLSRGLSLTRTCCLSHSFSFSLSLSLTRCLSHSWSLTYSLCLSHSFSFSLSLSLTHSLSLSHTRCLSHLLSLSHVVSLSFVVGDSHSFSLMLLTCCASPSLVVSHCPVVSLARSL